MDNIEFGPEIKVDGKRPEWLGDDQEFQARGGGFEWFGILSNGIPHIWNRAPIREPSWAGVDYIRLPANHPHYRTHSPATPPLSLSTGVDRVERMEALCRSLAAKIEMKPEFSDAVDFVNSTFAEARAIVSELPPLPDPDLVKAREIATEYSRSKMSYTEGDMDDTLMVQLSLAGIKAGRGMGR